MIILFRSILSPRYLREIARRYRRCCCRERDAGDISLIHRCMYACASAYAWNATRNARVHIYGKYQRLKEIRGNLHENSAGKGKRRGADSSRGYVKHKGAGNFFRADHILAVARPFVRFMITLKTPRARYVLTRRRIHSAAAYFFTRNDHFDVFVIDASPLTLRENRINQRRRAAWKPAGISVASAAINRIRDRQFTRISRRTYREIPTCALSCICIQHSM